MPESQKAEAELNRTDVAVSKKARAEETLNASGRRLSESSAAREGKPHVRFEVAGDENQDMVKVLRHSQKKWRATGLPHLNPGVIP